MAKNQNEIFEHDLTAYLKIAGIAVLGVLAIFLIVFTMNTIKTYTTIGENTDMSRSITVSGHGEASAKPDTATFTWTVNEDGTTVADSQNAAATKSNAAMAYLKQNGISDQDISTENYSTYEKYGTQTCPKVSSGVGVMTVEGGAVSSPNSPCVSSKVVGYTTTQTVQVKLKNVNSDDSTLGTLVAGLGKVGVQTSNVDFTFENPQNLKTMAEQSAIYNARQQAMALAESLGVSLGKVISFDDTSVNSPYPYGDSMKMMAASAGAPVPAQISSGSQKVNADVSVTFEIQ